MDIREQRYADVLVLELRGKINHEGADEFRERLLGYLDDSAGDYTRVVLDMSGVDYMSSVGLRALMLAAKKSKEVERPVVAAALNDTMKEIFEISRFNLVFELYDSVGDAFAAASEEARSAFAKAGS